MRFSFAAMAAALLLATAPALAHVVTHGELMIGHPWARATPGNAPAGGTFMSITNHGKTADRLLSASAPVSDKVELHTHVKEGEVMRMRPVEGGIDLPPGQTVVLQPGGLHVMLIGLKQPLKEGHKYPLTLTFEKAGAVTIDVGIQGVGAMHMSGEQMKHEHDKHMQQMPAQPAR